MSTFQDLSTGKHWREDVVDEVYRRKLAEQRKLAEKYSLTPKTKFPLPKTQRTPVQEPDSVQRERLARRDLANEFHTIRFVELDKKLYGQFSDASWHVSCDVCEQLPEIGEVVGISCRIFRGVFLVHKMCMQSVFQDSPMDGFEVIQDRLKNGGGLFE